MKETFYFSHDYNSRTDEKIVKLLSKHGMAGYGVFWSIVENLYNNSNVMDLDYDRIAYDLHFTDTGIIKSIINDFGLFIVNDGCFGSASIERRLQARDEKSEKARQSVLYRWRKNATAPNSDTNVSNKDTNVPKNDTIKDSIVKDSIKKEINVMSDTFSIDYKPIGIFDSLAFQLWKIAYDNKTGKGIKPTTLLKAKPATWANDVRLCIEADKRTEAEISEVLDFLRHDVFWINNVESPAKLRKQFERLQLEVKTPKKKTGNPFAVGRDQNIKGDFTKTLHDDDNNQ